MGLIVAAMFALFAGILVDPQGGFYLYARYDHPVAARDVCARLRDAGVAGRSGSEFGAAGERHLRFSYSVDEVTIDKGMAITADVFRRLGSTGTLMGRRECT